MSIGMSTKASDGNAKLFTVRSQSIDGAERLVQLAGVEEPLEIRILHWFKDVPKVDSPAILMRTPGFDPELVAGYLFGESILKRRSQLLSLHPLGEPASSNEYLAELSRDVDLESRVSHIRFVNSNCVLCGKRGIEAIPEPARAPLWDAPMLNAATILRVPGLLGSHSKGKCPPAVLSTAALIDATGSWEAVFDDVAPMNALYKLLGHCFLEGLELANYAICLTGGCSFELALKAIAAGAPILITTGAPTSLAIEAARARQLTLIGCLTDGGFNVYSAESRVR
jgi:FdhD protein